MSASLEILSADNADFEDHKIIWEVFFAARSRGLSLKVHAPWLFSGPPFKCIRANYMDSRVGCAILKPCRQEGIGAFGLIGFVCVRYEFRGCGVAQSILSKLLDEAKSMQLASLILWTQAPQLYEKLGFSRSQDDVLYELPSLPDSEVVRLPKPLTTPLKGRYGPRGLPPFASSAYQIKNGQAELLVLDCGGIMTLAEWNGPVNDVIDVVMKTRGQDWWVNALLGDELLEEIHARLGDTLGEQPSARMVLNLSSTGDEYTQDVRLLDRI